MNRVSVNPKLLQWARERVHLEISDLTKKFPKLQSWENGKLSPTFKQLEDFAKVTRVPFGYLFLPEPPDITMPIPDFRTVGNLAIGEFSPDLLETIYAMQDRQAWLREERQEVGVGPLTFAGSIALTDDPTDAGQKMRHLVGMDSNWREGVPTWREAVSILCESIEELGIITAINGMVGNNFHQKLNIDEFRGFALSDKYAPLIFVNGADTKSAQIFTLAHELAHICLGEAGSGLSNVNHFDTSQESGDIEVFCDKVAAEFLVPEIELRNLWPSLKHEEDPFKILARRFKVSPLIIGRRLLDMRLIERQTFFDFYKDHTAKEKRKAEESSGGNFYNNQNTRVGKLFATKVIRAAKEGRIGFKQAYALTGLNGGTFQKYAGQLGMRLP